MANNKRGSVLQPFTALKMLGQKPDTIKVPFECRPAADRYRGFHVNDLDKCIGCGTCAEICDNDAIRMVPVKGKEAGVGHTEYRPAIDYGRCCWCALCVDVCTTNSLNMTREYTHIDDDTNKFFIFPTLDGIHNEKHPLGWQADEEVNLLDLKRVEMEELGPEERGGSFVEIVKGFSKEQAEKEASRCVACGLCAATCPVHMNIPEYIDAIWKDDIAEAGRQMYKTNPLPDVCGRICTHTCETACSMGVRGEPISIRWLKRYAMDAIPAAEYPSLLDQNVVKPGKQSIAIVGAGPAGLSAAYYLVLMGYKVTIYEAYPKAGGMMRYGIPEYRLPYDTLDKDIDFILSLGVELKTNTRVGQDVKMETLKKDFDSVLIATGFHAGRSTRVLGAEHPMVFQAIDLLSRTTRDEEYPVKEKVVVIGGGNVALDIARTLARKQKAKYGKVDLVVTSLETRDIMPADEEEIVEGGEEGIVFHPGRGPEEIVVKEGNVAGLRTSRCTRVFDENGRFSPEFDKKDEELYECSMVVEAIGQAPDMAYLGDYGEKVEYDGRRIKVDQYYQSSLPWLFVVGDIIKGPDVINGVATGHNAALGVDFYLTHKEEDTVSSVDDVLEMARSFQAAQVEQTSAAVAAIESGALHVNGMAREVERIHEAESRSLTKLEELLGNANSRIHLRQEMGREIRDRDFAAVKEAEAVDTSSRKALVASLAERLHIAASLYNDIIHLTGNKEIEFTMELLRDSARSGAKRIAEHDS